MARIPLRTYNHEVENLIERGQIDEAIAHCKNILKQFPKHIETYRLLGKSFLESQRYAEAADILQRVLSVFPDDFVSQLGMSIIREDEGNLDAAIWHMERAYEVQPFNRPIQDELRRLYGRRDGAEPPRIRLTRGALVRMYARGDLYPQAIAEIRAAQAEDPSRIDLIVLLAKMYYLSGQKLEATEISSSLITKLPYCYEANRILMEVLPETSRAEDARIFQQRLFSLDPYAAFISPNAPSSSQVPEQTVMVEKVDWQPSMSDAQSPDWAKTIGVEWDESSEETLPDWLSAIQPGQAETAEISAVPEMLDEQPAAIVQSSDELIPEFLKEAGWESSDGTVEEQPLVLNELEPAEEEGEIVEAEIPDWLQSLAPDTSAVSDAGETIDEEDQMGWLEEILPAGAAAIASVEIADEFTQPDSIQSSDDKLVDLPEAEKGEILENADQPDWIQEISTETIDQTQEPAPETEETGQVPEWLAELSADNAQESEVGEEISAIGIPPGDPENIPDWTKQDIVEELDREITVDSEEQITKDVVEVEAEPAPDWLAELSADTPQESIMGEEVSSDEMAEGVSEEIPDWLKPEETEETVSEIRAATMETLAEETNSEEGTVPDWLSELSTDTAPETTVMDEIAPITADEVADWTKQAEPEEPVGEFTIDTQEMTAETAADDETVPDWLSELKQEAPVETSADSKVDVEDAAQQSLEVSAQEGTAWEPEIITSEQPAIDDQAAAEPALDSMDIDAAMAWMEALAARQGADEESLKISEPDQRSETPPEWITQLEETAQEDIPETSSESVLEVDVTALGLEESSELEEPGEEISVVFEEIPSEGLPGEEISPSLEEIEKPVEATTIEAVVDIGELNPDEAFAWLEALAAKQGAEEGTLVTAPEERPETPPEWVSQAVQEPELEESGLVSAVAEELPETSAVQEDETTLELPSEEVTSPVAELPEISEESIEPEAPSAELTAQPTETSEKAETEIPDWLRSYEEEQRSQEPVWKPDETFTPEAVAEEELPDWLIEETSAAPAGESTISQPDLTEQAAGEMPAADEVRQMPEWLKALQESQPAQEAPETPDQPESTWAHESTPEPSAPAGESTQAESPETDVLVLAQATLRSGDTESAAEQYTLMINAGQNLDIAIQDLNNALDQYPLDISLWQALGDAYIRSNRVQEALDSYTKAEELLR